MKTYSLNHVFLSQHGPAEGTKTEDLKDPNVLTGPDASRPSGTPGAYFEQMLLLPSALGEFRWNAKQSHGEMIADDSREESGVKLTISWGLWQRVAC